jgi:hypothetical protein
MQLKVMFILRIALLRLARAIKSLRPNQALKLTEWASPAGFTKKQLSAGSYVKHGT